MTLKERERESFEAVTMAVSYLRRFSVCALLILWMLVTVNASTEKKHELDSRYI